MQDMTHRPAISDELMQKVIRYTENEFNVPEDRVGFEHRVEVLIQQRRDLRKELEAVYEELEKKDAELQLGSRPKQRAVEHR